MGSYERERYLNGVVKEVCLSGRRCSGTWMIRKHKLSDEKFSSAAITSIHLVNSAPGLVLLMISSCLSPSLVDWILSSLSYSRESHRNFFFVFSTAKPNFTFYWFISYNVHWYISILFFSVLKNTLPLPPQLSIPFHWRFVKIFPLCLCHSTFGATPIMFSPSALIEAAHIKFTDNHNVDKVSG